jgi:peroxiredoxin
VVTADPDGADWVGRAARPPARPAVGTPATTWSTAAPASPYGPRFPLLTDADHSVMDAWGEKTRYGRTSVGVLRSIFLLDAQGRVERAWHTVRADGHAANVLAQLQS